MLMLLFQGSVYQYLNTCVAAKKVILFYVYKRAFI